MKEKRERHHATEGKGKLELDVDRMINEGMAGGMERSVHGREQLGKVHEIPEQEDD